jgi:hypothetical protein
VSLSEAALEKARLPIETSYGDNHVLWMGYKMNSQPILKRLWSHTFLHCFNLLHMVSILVADRDIHDNRWSITIQFAANSGQTLHNKRMYVRTTSGQPS